MDKIINLFCDKHGLTRFRKYKSGTNGYSHHCVKCQNEKTYERRLLNKLKAIEYCGGKCSRCGGDYAGNQEVFDFHHIDPSKKEKSPAHILGFSWDKIKKEICKCKLLCANCHRIVHRNINDQ